MHTHLSRRECLRQIAGGLTLAAGLSPLRARLWAADETAEKLLVRQEKPFNAEPALTDLLTNWQTPIGTFFQRSHGNVPDIDPNDYQLTIEGLVEKPRTFKLDALSKTFSRKSVTATITCAGNRRSEFPPEAKIGGVKWTGGAIGNAEWGGVPLAEVLKSVGIKPEARHVWFDGLDEITEGDKKFSFGASIPLEKAMTITDAGSACLLAHQMNKSPLPREHGGPLRGIMPGYIGARSVKWLGKITLSDRPSPNHYVADVYKLGTLGTAEEAQVTSPIYQHMLNSVACKWSLDAGKASLKVAGVALPFGQAECLIRNVDVSLDGGKSWTAAKLTSPQREFCWSFWEATLPADSIGKKLLVRATDTRGESQPRETPYNYKGYQYNAWHQVTLDV